MDERERLIQDVVNAWVVPGRNPVYHAEHQRLLRGTWSTLAKALEALAQHEATLGDGK